jgi:hypothetical protein
MKQLIIDRTVWYRGAGSCPQWDSALLTAHGMYCCLGIDAKACGFTDRQLAGDSGYFPSPGALFQELSARDSLSGLNPLPGLVHWDPSAHCTNGAYKNTDVASLMMEVNDAEIGAEFGIYTSAIDATEGLREYLTGNELIKDEIEMGKGDKRAGDKLAHCILRTEADREAILTLCFRSIGREVTFVN